MNDPSVAAVKSYPAILTPFKRGMVGHDPVVVEVELEACAEEDLVLEEEAGLAVVALELPGKHW